MTPEKLMELAEQVGSGFAEDVAKWYTPELLKLIELALADEKAKDSEVQP